MSEKSVNLGLLFPEEVETGKCPGCKKPNTSEQARCQICGVKTMKCPYCGATWQELPVEVRGGE